MTLSVSAPEDYVGRFYSPELDVAYEILEGDDALILRRRRFPDRNLVPRSADGFSAGNWRLAFSRDDAGGVNEFRITTGRVRNLRFVRQ